MCFQVLRSHSEVSCGRALWRASVLKFKSALAKLKVRNGRSLDRKLLEGAALQFLHQHELQHSLVADCELKPSSVGSAKYACDSRGWVKLALALSLGLYPFGRTDERGELPACALGPCGSIAVDHFTWVADTRYREVALFAIGVLRFTA